ncbi:hypothetical protein [Deinococcus hopiensis]|uniref:Uncharacterized protein n=1 Tax=Deinococcus hopiensis KR-140 TaxID=695939 RepID=A0A1W1VEF8_9DEIO|nr:hypothetical protein [Deinococcus hopiensis]SMB91603.1 hypothetical protein SAMN00790413_01212 [Deinococcus hopiensis KR-140]
MSVPSPSFPFTDAERNAAVWAIACAHLMLKQGERLIPPDVVGVRVPPLLPAAAALRAGVLDAQDADVVALALSAVCQARDQVPEAIWQALGPPPASVLDAARAKAARLRGVQGGLRA